jgi:putative oxidoreductase
MKSALLSFNHFFSKLKPAAPLVIRLLIGYHLIQAVKNAVFNPEMIKGVAAYFGSLGIFQPGFMAPLVVYTDLVCGILFIVGAFTRIAAFIIVIVFICALAIAHVGDSYSNMFPALVMLCGALFLLFNGPGPISLDNYLFKSGPSR